MVAILTEDELARLRDLAQRLEAKGLPEESRQLLEIVSTGGSGREVPVSVAADIFRVTSQTIRNWLRAGLLKGRLDATGRYYVDFGEVEPTLAMRAAQPRLAGHLYDIQDEEIVAAIREVRAQRRAAAER